MQKRHLTDDEQRRLLQAAKQAAGPLAERDHAWMRLLIETGMRVNELATTMAAQASQALAHGWLTMRAEQRKGHGYKVEPGQPAKVAKRKPHSYMVTEPVRQCLETLLRLNAELCPLGLRAEGAAPLLWGRCGVVRGKLLADHMSVRTLQARMAKWAAAAGLPPGVSPHWLRHTRGVNIIKRSRGKNALKVAQIALGHESIASTGIYTQMLREDFEREMHAVAGGRMPKAKAQKLAEVRA
ncbi:tyrosine-type recombinase/integrase [Variovorax sp. HJSM1_2]|uniref:tyrosine-type recombinase/integrase n=1 Tax=Variovorax sp. HJSM1_2 TaxID=3366263 RepID=UPI003BC75BC3